MKKIKKIIKRNKTIYNIILSVSNIINSIPYLIVFNYFKLKKIQNNKIVINNYYNKGYGDNAKYICEYLINNDLINQYNVVWICKKKYFSTIPECIRKIEEGTIKSYYELTTSKIWIDNCRKKSYIKKRKGQVYIQLWHGGIGMKKVEKMAEDTLNIEYIRNAKKDSLMIDYAISNSLYRTNIFKNYFWYSGEILEYGCPRNDIFFNNNIKDRIKDKISLKYGLSKDEHIILYAPTFRKSYYFNYESFDFRKLIESMEKKYKQKYKLFIRLHSATKFQLNVNNSKVIDVTEYPDSDELLLISDIIISDFSSIIFDALYTDSKKYLYAPDINLYNKDRGLNVEYEKLPFCISYNSDELIENILNEKSAAYYNKEKKYKLAMNLKDDGQASKRIVKLIAKIVEGEKNG